MTPFFIALGAVIIAAMVCHRVCNARINNLYDRLRIQGDTLASLEVLAENAEQLPMMRYNIDRHSYQIVRTNDGGQLVVLAEFSIETYGYQDARLLADELIETIEQFRYYNK